MIRFDIILSKNNTFIKVLPRILLLIAILSIILIFIDGVINGVYSNTSLIGRYGWILMLVLVSGYILIAIYISTTKLFSKIGEISLSESGISINTSVIVKHVSINDVESCIFKIKGFDGESPITRSVGSYKGNFNYFTIKTGNESFIFEVYISDSLKIKSLISIVNLWRKEGCPIDFYYNNKSY